MPCSQSPAAISSRMAVRGAEQSDVVALGKAAPLALTSTVDDGAVHEPATPAGLDTHQPGDRDPCRSPCPIRRPTELLSSAKTGQGTRWVTLPARTSTGL